MRSYYEVIVQLPNDVESQVPGISDSFVNWITSREWTLPEDADWDLDQVDQVQLTLGDKIQREIRNHWGTMAKEPDFHYFIQLEQGETFFHLHVLLETCSVKPMVLGRYIRHIQQKIVSKVYCGHEPAMEGWMRVTKTKNFGGANKVRAESYIPAYLIPKQQPEVQWAWTNVPEYIKACLHRELRASLARLHFEEAGLSQSKENLARTADGAPVIATRVSKRYMELVDWLVEKGITTEKEWLLENRESFRSFQASSNSARQIKTALQGAIQEMLLTKTAEDYLVGKDPVSDDDIRQNRIYKILELNHYDPAYVGSILVGWCQKKWGKRNTLWLFGPATTGKTNIAEAIAHAVPFYGCVNWTNENFPFNDCVEKMIIWWEEGKMTAKVVETAKAILGGSRVRVDQKCKASVPIEPTPVIITSNTNMCYVIDGNTTTFEHKQPLEDRMFKLELLTRLPDDFGKVTKQEVRQFFRWSQDHLTPVIPEFLVRKAESRKRPAPSGEGYISPTKRPALAEQQQASESAEPVPTRYRIKCSKHCGMDKMLFPCQICESMNRNINICAIHKTTECKECFPEYGDKKDTVPELPPCTEHNVSRCYQCHSGELYRVTSDSDEKPAPESDEGTEPSYAPCTIHHLMGKSRGLVSCAACRLKNSTLHDDLDDGDLEQ